MADFNSEELWNDFKISFEETVNEIDKSAFIDAWKDMPSRTLFYSTKLLPEISKKLGLSYQKEKVNRFDGVFYKTASQNTDVPVIYIESENDAKSSDREIFKLLAINAPLKVLLICNEWNENEKKEIAYGYWHYQITDFNDVIGLTQITH